MNRSSRRRRASRRELLAYIFCAPNPFGYLFRLFVINNLYLCERIPIRKVPAVNRMIRRKAVGELRTRSLVGFPAGTRFLPRLISACGAGRSAAGSNTGAETRLSPDDWDRLDALDLAGGAGLFPTHPSPRAQALRTLAGHRKGCCKCRPAGRTGRASLFEWTGGEGLLRSSAGKLPAGKACTPERKSRYLQ